jgi:hypothetical protein
MLERTRWVGLLLLLALIAHQFPVVNAQAEAPHSQQNNILSAACQAKLQQLNLSGNLPVVLIQLVNTSQAGPVSAAALQLLAKGPHLPGLMTTCGAPGIKV